MSPRDHLSLTPQLWNYKYMPPCYLFSWVLRIELGSSYLFSKPFTKWTLSLDPGRKDLLSFQFHRGGRMAVGLLVALGSCSLLYYILVDQKEDTSDMNPWTPPAACLYSFSCCHTSPSARPVSKRLFSLPEQHQVLPGDQVFKCMHLWRPFYI